MSFEVLKREVELLADIDRRRLLAFLVTLEDQGRAGYREKLARKIDDHSSDRWLSPEQCERELGLSE